MNPIIGILILLMWLAVFIVIGRVIWKWPKVCIWIATFLFLDFTVWTASLRLWYWYALTNGMLDIVPLL